LGCDIITPLVNYILTQLIYGRDCMHQIFVMRILICWVSLALATFVVSPSLASVSTVVVLPPLVSDCEFSADVNGDSFVNISDFTAFLCFFATNVGANPDCLPSADLNGDQHVGIEDLLLLLPAVSGTE
jgi:hypothetical protein